jgi:amino acid transporter
LAFVFIIIFLILIFFGVLVILMVATLVVAVVMTCMVVMAMLICRRPPDDRGVRASGRQPVSEPRGKGHGCLVFRTFRRLQPVS